MVKHRKGLGEVFHTASSRGLVRIGPLSRRSEAAPWLGHASLSARLSSANPYAAGWMWLRYISQLRKLVPVFEYGSLAAHALGKKGT